MTEFIILDYGNPADEEARGGPRTPKAFIVEQKELWAWLEKAKHSDRLIMVYVVGECVLDWS